MNETGENLKNKIRNFLQNKNYLYKYKYFAINLCSDLLDLTDVLNKAILGGEVGSKNIEEMRQFLKGIYLEIENLSLL